MKKIILSLLVCSSLSALTVCADDASSSADKHRMANIFDQLTASEKEFLAKIIFMKDRVNKSNPTADEAWSMEIFALGLLTPAKRNISPTRDNELRSLLENNCGSSQSMQVTSSCSAWAEEQLSEEFKKTAEEGIRSFKAMKE